MSTAPAPRAHDGPGAPGGSATPVVELSVLIVNYNTWRECAGAVATLRQHGPTRPDGSPMPFECIVVDNCSPLRDPAAIAAVEAELRELQVQQGDPLAGRLLLHGENGGYSKGMNLACQHARGRWLLISNPDLVFGPGLISRLQRHLEHDPKAGIVVPKGFWDAECTGHLPPNTLPTLFDAWVMALAEFSDTVRHWYSRRLIRSWMAAWQAERPLTLPMMSGCLFLIDRAFFAAIGRFDERYPLYYEDADLSVAIRRAGSTIVQVPDAHLVHFVNRSGMSDSTVVWSRHAVSREAYYRKWYGRLGAWTLRWTARLLQSERLRRCRRFTPIAPFTDLGASASAPRLSFDRHCDRYLVLLSLDRRFFLAAGTFGQGDHWQPEPRTFAQFVSATYFFLAYDISRGRLEPLGSWRFQCTSHLGHVQPEAPAVATAGGAP